MLVESHADQLGCEFQQLGMCVGLALRHEHQRLTVAASHRHRVVLGLGEDLGGVPTQVG